MKVVRKEILLAVINGVRDKDFGESEFGVILDKFGDEWFVEDGEWVCVSEVHINGNVAERVKVHHG